MWIVAGAIFTNNSTVCACMCPARVLAALSGCLRCLAPAGWSGLKVASLIWMTHV
jgi:hypothetical protein